jgi:hypothetical protein
MTVALLEVADAILDVSRLLADRPRPIDRVIDYFGGVPQASTQEPSPRRQSLAS